MNLMGIFCILEKGIGKFSLTSLEKLSYFEYRTSNEDQYVISIDRNFPDNLLIATGYGGVWLSSDYGNSFTKKSINTLIFLTQL